MTRQVFVFPSGPLFKLPVNISTQLVHHRQIEFPIVIPLPTYHRVIAVPVRPACPESGDAVSIHAQFAAKASEYLALLVPSISWSKSETEKRKLHIWTAPCATASGLATTHRNPFAAAQMLAGTILWQSSLIDGGCMKVSALALRIATIPLLVISNHGQAREIAVLSYQEMLAKSDLVVIADPISKTADTKEESFLPGIWMQESNGRHSTIKSIGVETVFSVSAVLKGDESLKRFTLHHYRKAEVINATNEPYLVHFDPSDISKRSSYLLFLVHEPDGRYAPIGGQTDPGMKAIGAIPFELHQTH